MAPEFGTYEGRDHRGGRSRQDVGATPPVGGGNRLAPSDRQGRESGPVLHEDDGAGEGRTGPPPPGRTGRAPPPPPGVRPRRQNPAADGSSSGHGRGVPRPGALHRRLRIHTQTAG